MLYSAKGFCDFHLDAIDGRVGKVIDLYFDDLAWTVRYLVVDTGHWLSGREVLIVPSALSRFPDDDEPFQTRLSRKQVQNSPAKESHLPVSRQYEESLGAHYGWDSYWNSSNYMWSGLYAYPEGLYPYEGEEGEPTEGDDETKRIEEHGKMHLRSLKEVCGYTLHATDGSIGELHDLIVEPETWRLTHLIADTRVWWPGKHVIIDKGMIREFSWLEHCVKLGMTRAAVKGSPEFHPGMSMNEAFQADVSHYYQHLSNDSLRDMERSHVWESRPGIF